MLSNDINRNNIYFYIDKNKIISNFNSYSHFGNIYYPLKTNSNTNVLNTLIPLINHTNHKFLISYIDHFNILHSLNVEPKYMCLMNVLATNETVKHLYNQGVRTFTFDNLDSVISFSEYADLNETTIMIRLSTIDIYNQIFTHLGATTEECYRILEFLNNKCKNVGISFYLNSEVKKDKSSLNQMLLYISNHFKNYFINFINIGGIESSELLDNILLKNIKKQLNLDAIHIEPGQSLIGNTIDIETEIIRTKSVCNKRIIAIKHGIFSGFLDKLLYNKQFNFYFQSHIDGKIKIKYNRTSNNDIEFIMYGGSSDSADSLGTMYIDKKYEHELVEGSSFYVEDVGAYFEEFFMAYGNDLKINYIEK